MKYFKNLWACLVLFSTPLYKASKEVDDFVNLLLSHGKIIDITEHDIIIRYDGKTVQLWNANKWYSFGCRCSVENVSGNAIRIWNNSMPYMYTILKMSKKIEAYKNALKAKRADTEEAKLHNILDTFNKL